MLDRYLTPHTFQHLLCNQWYCGRPRITTAKYSGDHHIYAQPGQWSSNMYHIIPMPLFLSDTATFLYLQSAKWGVLAISAPVRLSFSTTLSPTQSLIRHKSGSGQPVSMNEVDKETKLFHSQNVPCFLSIHESSKDFDLTARWQGHCE